MLGVKSKRLDAGEATSIATAAGRFRRRHPEAAVHARWERSYRYMDDGLVPLATSQPVTTSEHVHQVGPNQADRAIAELSPRYLTSADRRGVTR